MTKQVDYANNMWNQYNTMREKMAEISDAYDKVKDEVYKDGVISMKNKRLMALAIAIKEGCQDCILSQTKRAIDLGVSNDEIFETCGVAISMGGTIAQSNALKVIQYLDELKRI